jgi:energy-converting hydrogenase A subunit M
VWNHIIGNKRYIPADQHAALRHRVTIANDGDYNTALQDAEDEFLRQNVPSDLWRSVLLHEIGSHDDQVLVRFPVAFSRVIEVRRITKALAEARRNTRSW